jgi:hypothetical protein
MLVSEETIDWDCQDDSISFAGFVHPFEDGSETILSFISVIIIFRPETLLSIYSLYV